jgi:hypothetical protein
MECKFKDLDENKKDMVGGLKVKKKRPFSSTLFLVPLVAGILLSSPKKALCKDRSFLTNVKCTVETCINERKTWVSKAKYEYPSGSDRILKEYTVVTAELPLVHRIKIETKFKPLPIIDLTNVGIEFAAGSGTAKAEDRIVKEYVSTREFGDIITEETTVQTREFNTSLNATSIFLGWMKDDDGIYVQLSYNGDYNKKIVNPGIWMGFGARLSYNLTEKLKLKINILLGDPTTDNFITPEIVARTGIGEFGLSALPIRSASNSIRDLSVAYNFFKIYYSYTFGSK